MIRVLWDEGFKRIYKKKTKNNKVLKDKFWQLLKLFVENPFHSQLRTHKLSGKLSEMWAFSITYEYRIIFKFIDKKEILLIDIGSHDEVY